MEESEQQNQNQQGKQQLFAFYQAHSDKQNGKRESSNFKALNYRNSLFCNEQQLSDQTKQSFENQTKNLQELLFNNNDTNTSSPSLTSATKQLLFCDQLLSKNYHNSFEDNNFKIKPEYLELNVDDQTEMFFKNNLFENKLTVEQSVNCCDRLLIGN